MSLKNELQHHVIVDMEEAQIKPVTRDRSDSRDLPDDERSYQYCQNDLMLVYQVLLKAYMRGSEIIHGGVIESESS
ncbi:MAG: hypothetical protein IAE83_01380 [Anaerolinea sp.]|nr:hypothetical protein [Anaerolinea sp.]